MLSQCARCGGLYETDPIVPVTFGGQACRCTAPLKQPTAQLQYREPTLEDARELVDSYILAKGIKLNTCMLNALKQLGFVRKVQP